MENLNLADADCLRNAWNDHPYSNPAGLRRLQARLATVAASIRTPFRGVFTGAFFEVLAGMLALKAGNNPLHLWICSRSAVICETFWSKLWEQAPLVSGFYASIAEAMVEASLGPVPRRGPAVQQVFQNVFVRRKILPPPAIV